MINSSVDTVIGSSLSLMSRPEDDRGIFDILGDKKTIKDLDLFPKDWNITSDIEDIQLNADFAWLLFILLKLMIWVTYYVFYHSRVSAFILTVLMNTVILPRYFVVGKKSQRPFMRIGSLSISFISGKVMFRDFAFICPDFTLRILDGFVIFRWWVPYFPKDLRNVDCSNVDTRVNCLFNGFELHIFNRSQLYSSLEKVFNLPSKLFPLQSRDRPDDDHTSRETDPLHANDVKTSIGKNRHEPETNDDLITAYLWRDLIPVTKIEVSTGKFVFGNTSMPTILSFNFDEGFMTYTSKPSQSPNDLFAHIAKVKLHRFKVVLIPSPKYLGLTDEPPRYMGEGFVVIQCKAVDINYYQDEPGLVSLEPEKIELVSGDVIEKVTHPSWGMDVKCEKSCTLSYGPWADRQRESLYNFFYPIDYKDSEVQTKAKRGDIRSFEKFEFKLNLLAPSMFDILFTRGNKETNVLHMGVGSGSYLEITIPWVTKETGYESSIKGQILHLDAKTCLNYRYFAEAETLEFDLKIKYPHSWNHHQKWQLNLTGHRATVNLIFAHKIFFCDLIDDWADKSRPDILKFVPYTWKINLILKEFELITLCNEGNWIDCSSKQMTANTMLAICGEDFELAFDLPFTDFLPVTVPLKIWIQGQSLDAAIHVPKTNPFRDVIESLESHCNLCSNVSDAHSSPRKTVKSCDLFKGSRDHWRRYSSRENGWVTCWSVPIVAISINYTYHPNPPIFHESFPVGNTVRIDTKVMTPSSTENEEVMLQPLKPDTLSFANKKSQPPSDFYPGSLSADVLDLEIEIGPSTVCLYGTILKILWDIKENYVGECRSFTDITEKPATKIRRLPFSRTAAVTFTDATKASNRAFDPRLYRPFEVRVSLAMHDIHAHLMKPCTESDPSCPYLYFERLSFEMDKKFTQTKMQLLLSPLVLNASDNISRPEKFKYLSDGFILLSSLQFRGHAMFSEIGRPLESDTLEYAWLIDLQLGEVSGRLTLPQLSHVVSSVDTLAGGVLEKDSIQPPPAPVKCLHDAVQANCVDTDSGANKVCPNPEEIKYRVVRMSLSSVDVSLAELHTLTNVSIIPVKLSTCNVHANKLASGVTGLIEKVKIKQFLLKESDTSLRAKMQESVFIKDVQGNWMPIFSLVLGPIFLDTSSTSPILNATHATTQDNFLKIHDERTKFLWFLWRRPTSDEAFEKCGCIGGCAFFNGRLTGNSYFDLAHLVTMRKKGNAFGDSMSRKRRSRQSFPEGVKLGESILRAGEAMMGFSHSRVQSRVEDYEDEDEVTLRGSVPPPVGSPVDESISSSRRRSSEEALVYPIRLSSSSHTKTRGISFVQRQMSSPARSSPFTTKTQIIPSTRSAQSASMMSMQSPTSTETTGPYLDALPHFASKSSTRSIPVASSRQTGSSSNRHLSSYHSLTPGVSGFDDGSSTSIASDLIFESASSLRGDGNFYSGSSSARHARTQSIDSQSTLTEPYFSAEEGDDADSCSSDSGTLRTAPSNMKPTISLLSEDKSLFSALDVMMEDDDPRSASFFGVESNLGKKSYLPGRVFEEIPEKGDEIRSDRTKVLFRIDGTTGVTITPISSGGLRTMTETIRDISNCIHLKYLRSLTREDMPHTPVKRFSAPGTGDFIVEIERGLSNVTFGRSSEHHRHSPAPPPTIPPNKSNVSNVIYGAFKLERVTSSCAFSGLKLEGGLSSFSVSLTHNQKVRSGRDKWTESSLTSQVESTRVSLFEQTAGFQDQLIMKMNLATSQILINRQDKQGRETNSAHLIVGPIILDIPQQPSTLHGMVSRSSRQITSTLQELRQSSRQPSRVSRFPPEEPHPHVTIDIPPESVDRHDPLLVTGVSGGRPVSEEIISLSKKQKTNRPIIIIGNKELVVNFSLTVESFTIGAALLPSLRTQYQILCFKSSGVTGDKGRFMIDLQDHHLSFTASSQDISLPSFAKVSLPSVHVLGEYLEMPPTSIEIKESFYEPVVLRDRSYVRTMVDIGFFEYSLTTDLLNHLIVIQKEFVKEINEVVLKMSGGDMIVIPTAPANSDGGRRSLLRMSQGRSDLYQLTVTMKGTQVTATTPSNSAVRFSTGPLDLEVSNLPASVIVIGVSDDSASNFHVKLSSVKIEVDLNVACKAEYHIPDIDSSGTTGEKGNFIVDVADHYLSFDTNVKQDSTSTKVSLPPIHVSGEWREDSHNDPFNEGVLLRKGPYLESFADIDFFEHSLTTDLLNHLILVQKEFMKEVNLVVTKMYSGNMANVIPIVTSTADGAKKSGEPNLQVPPVVSDSSVPMIPSNSPKQFLFSLHLSLKGIQITAMTPTNNAVRMETSEIQFQLSNRVQQTKTIGSKSRGSSFEASPVHDSNKTPGKTASPPYSMQSLPDARIYFRLQFDFNVALGQLIRNPVFEEADAEFQPFAYFKTRVVVRNSFQDQIVNPETNCREEREAILFTLNRPLIYIQPLALDKAVLVWLNYKNAYEYWDEQRAIALHNVTNSPILSPQGPVQQAFPTQAQMPGQSLQGLFLQLTFDDLGICLPITHLSHPHQMTSLGNRLTTSYDSELKSALVVTLESTTISASSHGTLVSKGKFKGLCFRFADDFETSLDDWKPDANDPSIMNIGVVSEGTYEICSRTTTGQLFTQSMSNQTAGSSSVSREEAKWFLNVSWKMEGFDIHVDTSIGKQLSGLFSTLTALAGDDIDDNNCDASYASTAGDLNEASVIQRPLDLAEVVSQTAASSAGPPSPSKDPREHRHSSVLEGVNLRKSSLLKESSVDNKKRSRLIEKELNEQAKIINDLRQEGASQTKLETEIKKLQELEFAIFNDFRRDVMKKLRRQSSKPGRPDDLRTKRYERMSRMPTMISPEKQDAEFLHSVLSGMPRQSVTSDKDTSESTTLSPTIEGGSAPSSVAKDNDSVFATKSESNVTIASKDDNLKVKTCLKKSASASSQKKKRKHRLAKVLSIDSKTPSTEETPPLGSDSGSDPYLTRMTLSSTPSTPTSPDSTEQGVTSGSIDSTSSSEESSDDETSSSEEEEKADVKADVSETKKKPFVPQITAHRRHASVGGSATSSFGQGVQKFGVYPNPVQEPSIDFELEVMVYFNSGKCVFHTREQVIPPTKDEDSVSSNKRTMMKEKSFVGLLDVSNVGGGSSVPSPKSTGIHPRYQMRSHSGTIPKNTSQGLLKGNASSSRLKPSSHTNAQHNISETTVFLIPGLDIKVSYNSKNVFVDLPTQGGSSGSSVLSSQSPLTSRPSFISKEFDNLSSPSSGAKKVLTKKASCSAWMTLHCIPEETVITPHILDFLEQALEPIPLDSPKASTPSNDGEGVLSQGDLMASAPGQYAVYGSFPVDVIVYLHVEPSVVRFSCLPVSRVECLLQLPSVELTFSSKKDEEDSMPSAFEKSRSLPARAMLPPKYSGHRRIGSDYRSVNPIESTLAGMSMTGCLADFSLYIFHPYGGQKKTSITTPSTLNTDISGGSRPLTGRKDSLSLQVEFVKVDISRSRKLIWSLQDNSKERQCLHAIIRFSASCDVGSASFKYDMRRLGEILAFPKAWYRKAIWRRMFLGDESLRSAFTDDSDGEDMHLSSSDSIETLDTFGQKDSPLRKETTPESSNEGTKKESLWLNLNDPEQPRKNGEWKQFTAVKDSSKGDSLDRRTSTPWETLVVFNLNLSKLNIQMNMGNVMGNTTWLSRGFKSDGRVAIDSSGHKGFLVKLKLDASSLDAKGGIVGGVIDLSNISTEFNLKEDRGKEPLHTLKLSLKSLQKRLDYMGTSILMLRISSLDLTLKDEWIIDQAHISKDHPTKRPALIFIHSQLVWDQLQILMSKSTTPDITKICAKLEEFFTQQFHSSVRVLSALEPTSKAFHRSSLKSRPILKKQSSPQQPIGSPVLSGQPHIPSNPEIASNVFNIEARHHRHWQKVLKLVSGVTLSTLSTPLPAHGTILGGTVQLTGKNISLACFYGINFRSKAWGLFSLKEPTISFATEAQDVMNEVEGMDTHVIQNLSVSLGRSKVQTNESISAQHTTMATVCRMSRSVMFPPQFRKMNEWFEYAFATSELDEVKKFPVDEFESSTESQTTSLIDKRRISSASPKSSSQEFHHNKEVIFALPSFQMELKTEHLQAPKTPSTNSPKPSVDCTFVTDFDDHIFVAVDAEAYFFLHELITSYIREREIPYNKPQSSSSSMTESPLIQRKKKVTKEDSTESTTGQTDWRDFFCHTWHLEPTVRLLSWAGKNIEPYGVDYILQRLGFSQARTTIPKWIQRGAMDPLDKILAIVMYRNIKANAIESTVAPLKNKNQEETNH